MRAPEVRKGNRSATVLLYPEPADDDQIKGLKVYLRAGKLCEWLNTNPVLADRELVYAEDVNSFKVGDGTRTFAELPWWSPEVDE